MTPRDAPFFVVGNPRSGTTLLRFMLLSHPRLYIPGESGFIPFLDHDPARPLDPAATRRLLDRIAALHAGWREELPEAEGLHAELVAANTPTLGALLDTLYRRRMAAEKPGAARWGDKTPGYVAYLPQIARIFPAAKVIHLIRDGRDAALSARAKWAANRGRGYMDLYYLLSRWRDNVRAGRTAGRALGAERYLELRYEALVAEPRPSLERLCLFLGERYDPVMLAHQKTARAVGVEGQVGVLGPVSGASVGRWREEMTPFERRVAERLVGPLLGELGYERPTPGAWSNAERARYAAMAARYRVASALRAALYATGRLTLNRGRRTATRSDR